MGNVNVLKAQVREHMLKLCEVLMEIGVSNAEIETVFKTCLSEASDKWCDAHNEEIMGALAGALETSAAQEEEKAREAQKTRESMEEFGGYMDEMKRQGFNVSIVHDEEGAKVKVEEYVILIPDVLILGKLGKLDLESIRRRAA